MGAAAARGAPRPPGWPLLLAASVPAVPWTTVLATVAGAGGLAALLPLTPASGDALLLPLAVLVLACGWATAADERTAPGTATTPVPSRRRLLARVLLVVPVSAAALTAVAAVARAADAHPGRDLLLLWLATGALALAAGAAARRVVDVPGVAAAAALVGGGLVLVTALPREALTAAAWDSTGERVAAALVSAALLLAPALRDPAARPLRRRRVPR